MIKKVYVNGVYTTRRGSINIDDDVKFLLKKKVDFIKVGKKISFTNPNGQDIIWLYERD